MNNIRKVIKKLSKNGFFALYFSSILTKVFVLFGGVLIVRILSVDDYAIYTLINNAFSILTILGDFGVSSAILLYLIESKNSEEKYNSYLKFGIRFGLISSIISALVIILSPFFYPYRSQLVKDYSVFLCFIPFFIVAINIINAILRANNDNKKYSLYQIVHVFSHYAVIVPMCMIFGVFGSVFSQYVYYSITVVIGLFLVKKYINGKKIKKILLSKKEKFDFFKYSVAAQTVNLTNTLLYSIDIFVIGQLVVDSQELSLYKVATIIPNALSFLPVCLMVYFVPLYVSHNKDIDWIKNNNKKLFKYGFIVYLIISVILILSSKYIFLLLYGEEYVESMYAFIILVIGFLFNSTFKVPIGNIISALKYPVYNTIANVICLVCNLVFNYLFISIFGYIGAAITTTSINIISSILYLFMLKNVLNKTMKKNKGILKEWIQISVVFETIT